MSSSLASWMMLSLPMLLLRKSDLSRQTWMWRKRRENLARGRWIRAAIEDLQWKEEEDQRMREEVIKLQEVVALQVCWLAQGWRRRVRSTRGDWDWVGKRSWQGIWKGTWKYYQKGCRDDSTVDRKSEVEHKKSVIPKWRTQKFEGLDLTGDRLGWVGWVEVLKWVWKHVWVWKQVSRKFFHQCPHNCPTDKNNSLQAQQWLSILSQDFRHFKFWFVIDTDWWGWGWMWLGIGFRVAGSNMETWNTGCTNRDFLEVIGMEWVPGSARIHMVQGIYWRVSWGWVYGRIEPWHILGFQLWITELEVARNQQKFGIYIGLWQYVPQYWCSSLRSVTKSWACVDARLHSGWMITLVGKEGCNAGSGLGVLLQRTQLMEGVWTSCLLVVAIDLEVLFQSRLVHSVCPSPLAWYPEVKWSFMSMHIWGTVKSGI